MGWRGAVRSARAASRRVERANQKVINAGNRQLERLNRSASQMLEKARKFEALLEKDPIKALELRYTEKDGFQSEPYKFQAGIFFGSLTLTPESGNEDVFKPATYEIGEARVEALSMLITPWATIVAIKITSDARDYRVKLNWVKKTNRSESKIVLVDDFNDQYYYPLSTDLGGEVFPGIPKTGLIAFEPFREPTQEVQLRICGVRFTVENFEPELIYHYQPRGLEEKISEAIAKPPLPDQINEKIQDEVNRGKQLVHERVKAATSSGCLVVLAFPALLFLIWAMRSIV